MSIISAPECRRDLSEGSLERSIDGLSLGTMKLHFRRLIVLKHAQTCPKWPKITSQLLNLIETCSEGSLERSIDGLSLGTMKLHFRGALGQFKCQNGQEDGLKLHLSIWVSIQATGKTSWSSRYTRVYGKQRCTAVKHSSWTWVTCTCSEKSKLSSNPNIMMDQKQYKRPCSAVYASYQRSR